jgi:O-antigen ligase
MTNAATMNPAGRVYAPLQAARPGGRVAFFTRWAFYVFACSFPFEMVIPGLFPEGLEGMLSIPRVLGGALLITALLDPGLRPWRIPKTFFLFAAFALAYAITSLQHSEYEDQYLKVYQLLQNMLLFLISYNIFRNGQATRGALWAYVIGCCTSSIMTLSGVVNPERVEKLGGRVGGLFWDENIYAYFMILALILLIGLNYTRKQPPGLPRFLSWPLMILLLLTVFRTGSRGATVALAVGIVTLIFKYGSFWVKARNTLLVSVFALVGVAFFSRAEVMMERWKDPQEIVRASGRYTIFSEALGMIKEKPVTGWHPAAAEEELAVRTNSASKETSTHNVFLQVLVELGLAGAVPYYLGLLGVVISAWRARHGVEDILPFSLWMLILAMQMSLAGFEGKMIWMFYGYGLAAADPILRGASRVPALVKRVPKNAAMFRGAT